MAPQRPKPTPPKWLDKLLERCCAPELLEEVLGDLHERYYLRVQQVGEAKAKRGYWREVLAYLRPSVIKRQSTYSTQPIHTAMFKNYFKIAFRHLRKNQAFSLINLSGLALGMAAFMLILQYISFEQSFNRFHTQLPQTYRILFANPPDWFQAGIPAGIAPLCQDNFAGVQDYCRVAGQARGVVTYLPENKGGQPESYQEENVAYVDDAFFTMFSFPLVEGDAATLQSPNTAAVSVSYAQKYFGDDTAIGKELTLNNRFGSILYIITAVYQDAPLNSDLRYDMVFSIQTLANPDNLNGNNWAQLDELEASYLSAFLLLEQGADPNTLEQQVNDYKSKLLPDSDMRIRLQRMEDMHLGASLDDPHPTYGKLSFVYLLSGIALLILVIAWFNYINLSTAGAIKRAKEVGIRKVVGANRNQLVGQFLGESILLNSLGFLLALLLAIIMQPYFNELTGKSLSLEILWGNGYWLPGLLLLLAGSIVSGAYTAFALSSANPLSILKSNFAKIGQGAGLRRALVVFQFTMSIALIIGTLVILRQLQFMRNQDLGMNIEQLLVVQGPLVGKDSSYQQRMLTFQHELAQRSYVQDYTNSGSVPSNWYEWSTDGVTRLNVPESEGDVLFGFIRIDENYLSTYGIPLIAGTNFTSAMCARDLETVDQILINETAALTLGFASAQDAIGQRITDGQEHEIIGVVKDYNHESLQVAIIPVVFFPDNIGNYLSIRLTADQMQSKVGEIGQLYKQQFPGNPFEFFFADERYNQQYQSEQQYGQVFTAASGLAIFIACLGLFGLAAFSTQQRVKEIGIRKVLGASISSIIALVSKDFLLLVMIANLFAWPLAWWATRHWLQDFAYSIDVNWWFFALSGAIAILIALLTVSFQSIKAALANPVDSLRNE